MKTIQARQQQRSDTAANWAAANPVLLCGEIGFESDTRKWKIGDGASAWNALTYQTDGTGSGTVTSVNRKAPDSGGNVTLAAEDVGAAAASHTHSASEVGARPDTWTPTAADVGAAAADHTQTPSSIGAAAASHTHTPASIGAATSGHTHSAATTSKAGFLSASDKTKLNGIATGANKYVLPVAGTALGGVKNGGNVTVNEDGTMTAPEGGGAVESVNGKTGAVTLAAADVGAAAKTHSHSELSTKTLSNGWSDAIGADSGASFYYGQAGWPDSPDSEGGTEREPIYGIGIGNSVQMVMRNNAMSNREPWAGFRTYLGSGVFSQWFPFVRASAFSVATVTDWDNAYLSGFYYGYNAANAPAENSRILGWVISSESNLTGVQFAWCSYPNPALYTRSINARDETWITVDFGTWQNIFSLST